MCLSDAICSWNSVGTFKYDNPWGFRARPTYSLKHVVSRYSHTPDHDYRNGKRQVVFVTKAQKLKLCVQHESPACVKCLGIQWRKLPSCDILALWICIHSKNIKYILKSVARISANTSRLHWLLQKCGKSRGWKQQPGLELPPFLAFTLNSVTFQPRMPV